MVECSTCLGWYHPYCVFTCSTPLSFTRKQWSKLYVACEGVKVNRNYKASLVYRHKRVETKRGQWVSTIQHCLSWKWLHQAVLANA